MTRVVMVLRLLEMVVWQVARRRERRRLQEKLQRRRRLWPVEEVSCLKKRAKKERVLWTGKPKLRRRRPATSGPNSSETLVEGLRNQNLNLLVEEVWPLYWPPLPLLQLRIQYLSSLKVGLVISLKRLKKAEKKLLVKGKKKLRKRNRKTDLAPYLTIPPERSRQRKVKKVL